ncbi:MAG: hypothetical protein HYU41_28100 [Candidatus Rokubacteria bacterium]|nr:hypothetical protein [Candidatus Rokubacteria bacterium]
MSLSAPPREWALHLAAAYDAIAMIIRFDVRNAAPGEQHVCLVMKDGGTAEWFAAGKGIEGMAWTTVPGRDVRDRILADPRVAVPGLVLYMSFCDVRPLIFAYGQGGERRERIAGEELLDVRYEVLFPEADRLPEITEFFYCWGRP